MKEKQYIYVVYMNNIFGNEPTFFKAFKTEEEAIKESVSLGNHEQDIFYSKVELI